MDWRFCQQLKVDNMGTTQGLYLVTEGHLCQGRKVQPKTQRFVVVSS